MTPRTLRYEVELYNGCHKTRTHVAQNASTYSYMDPLVPLYDTHGLDDWCPTTPFSQTDIYCHQPV